MPAAADTSPLIVFARSGYLWVLRSLFGEIWIPPRVAFEGFLRDRDRPGAAELSDAADDWLKVSERPPPVATAALVHEVDQGEAEAIALAHQYNLLLLIDDLPGRRAAERLGVEVIGSAGVLTLAKRLGIVPAVRPVLDALRAHQLRLSASLYQQILADVAEAGGSA